MLICLFIINCIATKNALFIEIRSMKNNEEECMKFEIKYYLRFHRFLLIYLIRLITPLYCYLQIYKDQLYV